MADIDGLINELVDHIESALAVDSDYVDCVRTDTLQTVVGLLKESNRSKHGHWIVLQDCLNSGVYCSECMNKMFDRYPMKKKFSQYCGHCGAHNDLQIEIR